MSKAIRSYPQSEKRGIISRRIDRKSGGLGYWAAMDAQKHQGETKKVVVKENSPDVEATEDLVNGVETPQEDDNTVE